MVLAVDLPAPRPVVDDAVDAAATVLVVAVTGADVTTLVARLLVDADGAAEAVV